MKRVVITGSESTGKSTLARRLAAHYDVEWVPEFVREYVDAKRAPLDFSDHGAIARGQMAREDEAATRSQAQGAALLLFDTDLLSTAVYCAHYYGRCPLWIAQAARKRRPDLYLLLDIDLPWTPDPQRDRGDRREEMHGLFERAVIDSGAPYALVRGHADERERVARSAIDRLLSQ